MENESGQLRADTTRGPFPRKLDIFSTFVLALTAGAIASQVFVIIWLSSRGLR